MAAQPNNLIRMAEIFAAAGIAADQIQGGHVMGLPALSLYRGAETEYGSDPSPQPSPLSPGARGQDVATEAWMPSRNPSLQPTTLTVQEAYTLHYATAGASERTKATADSVRRTIDLLGEWWRERNANTRITHPGVGTKHPGVGVAQITTELVREFQEWCRSAHTFDGRIRDHKGDTGSTLDKRWRELRSVIYSPGPGGRPLVERKFDLPSMRPQTEDPEDWLPPRQLSLAELDAMYRACDVAVWPERTWLSRRLGAGGRALTIENPVPAPLFWRTAIVLWTITGLRCEDLIDYTHGSHGLEMKHLHLDATNCPWTNTPVTWSHGWIRRVPAKTRRHGKMLVLPLPSIARVHLDALLLLRRQATPAAGQVFLCPCTNRDFYSQWDAIVASARERTPIPEPCTIHDLRRTCAGLWDRAKLGLGEHVLCHAKGGVHQQSYQNVIPELLDACPRLPIPAEFVAGAERLRPEQGKLF